MNLQRASRRNAVVVCSDRGGQRTLGCDLPSDVHDRFVAIAKTYDLTKGGLLRVVAHRIAERPDLLAAIMPERRP